MAGAVAGRAFRATVPADIEEDLAALWREIGVHDAPVARAVMSNLVVFRERTIPGDAEPADMLEGLPLDAVAARHPSRTIVLERCYQDAASMPLAAGVGITTFGPPHARYGVEQIVVRAACPNQALLSILRRFVRGDLPTTVWWTADMSEGAAMEPFIEVGRQLLFDSRSWRDLGRGLATTAAAIADGRIDPADLNWRRLTSLRRALEHARGPLSSPAWQQVPVRVGAAAGDEALAWLCAGWIRSARRESDRGNVVVEPLPATDVPASAPRRLAVSIEGLTATLSDRGTVVEGTEPALVVSAAVETEADAIAAELESLARDAALIAAIRAAAAAFAKA